MERRGPYSTRLGIRLPEPGEPNTTPRTRPPLAPLSPLCPPARVASGSMNVGVPRPFCKQCGVPATGLGEARRPNDDHSRLRSGWPSGFREP